MKMRKLNWFNCRNGRDKSRLIRRTVATIKELICELAPIEGIINPIFKNQFDTIEIARLEPYGGAFIYIHALGGLKEVDRVNGHYFWRWLEEWQWPEIIVKYKITLQESERNISNTSWDLLFETIYNLVGFALV